MIAPDEVVDGRYRLRRRIGTGGSGEVWHAVDETLHREVALKVVAGDVEPDRLRREARAAARVAHANVVAVFDAGSLDDRAYLVMELVDGIDLGSVVHRGGPLPPAVVATIARDLAAALAAVHAAGIVHRDVSPGNLVATRDGTVKLTDLGTARLAGGDGVDRLTRTGIVVGTVDYLAPEQLGPEHVTPATDVYAAGLVLRTCATAERPFGGGTVAERAARRLAEDPPHPRDVPSWLVELVATTCRREPADRPADGAALTAALDELVPPASADARAALGARVRAAMAGGADRPDDQGARDPADDPVRDRTVATTPGDHPGGTVVLDVPASMAPPPRPEQRRDHPDPGPPPTRPPSASPARRSPRPRRTARRVVLALVLVAAAVAATVLVTGGPGEPVAIVGVSDHDPDGDGREHPEELDAAVDGDPDTAWTTEGYETADLGGLKDGVGIVLDLGGRHTVRSVRVELGVPGVDLEVHVTDEPPAGSPEGGATLLGSATDAAGTVTLRGGDVTGRWVTLWLTGLGEDVDGLHRAAVREVEVRS